MTSQRKILMSGQVYGAVAWQSKNRKEVGLFLTISGETKRQVRCIVYGKRLEKDLSDGVDRKGMMLTASGLLSARIVQQVAKGSVPEILVNAAHTEFEPPLAHPVQGSIEVALKGVVLHWDPVTCLLKTFINREGSPNVTISLTLSHWLQAMLPASRENFLASIASGREFVASGPTEVSYYSTRQGIEVPVLQVFPRWFQLQG